MPLNATTTEDAYHRFITRALETGEVWGLCRDADWAYCASSEYEETEVLVFWSERAAAQQHVQGEWGQHKATAIALEEFIENWLHGMKEDGVLVGPNWGTCLEGLEVEPDQMAEDLTAGTPE